RWRRSAAEPWLVSTLTPRRSRGRPGCVLQNRGRAARRARARRRSAVEGLVLQLVAQLVLQHLQRGVARQRVDHLELLGDLLRHQPGLLAPLDHLVELQWLLAGRRLDDCGDALAALAVGQADDRDVADLR